MEWAVKTHTGKVRDNNEDSYYADENNGCVFIVADGMGGHNAGEIASKMAIEIIEDYINKKWGSISASTDYDVHVALREAILEANKKIYEKSLLNIEYDGMGTTITIAVILNNKVYFGHIGDSRAYQIANNEITQLTEDHTLVCELLKNGSITETEARNHPKKNIITKALGTDINIEPDIFSVDIINKDSIIVLCTDGLTNMVNDDEIKECFLKYSNLEKSCDELVDLANGRGGYDNMTVLAIRI